MQGINNLEPLIMDGPNFCYEIQRAIRRVTKSLPKDEAIETVCLNHSAIFLLQVAAESYLTDVLRSSQLVANIQGHRTTTPGDIKAALEVIKFIRNKKK
jgi:histone H3/H4